MQWSQSWELATVDSYDNQTGVHSLVWADGDPGATEIDLLQPERHKFREWVWVLPDMTLDMLIADPFEIDKRLLGWLRANRGGGSLSSSDDDDDSSSDEV